MYRKDIIVYVGLFLGSLAFLAILVTFMPKAKDTCGVPEPKPCVATFPQKE